MNFKLEFNFESHLKVFEFDLFHAKGMHLTLRISTSGMLYLYNVHLYVYLYNLYVKYGVGVYLKVSDTIRFADGWKN